MKLRTAQNTAARVLTNTKKFDHITPVLHQLYWLPVRQRITFKLAMITYKWLHGLAPSYLADVCIPISSVVGRWQLRSADSGTLIVPRTRTTIGRRDFAILGPVTYNTSLSNCGLRLGYRYICKNTRKSFLWLLVSLSNWCYINLHIQS